MLIVVAICGLAIAFAFEIRFRMISERLNQLENDTHKLIEDNKKISEELKKKQDAEVKKGFKWPFIP